MQKTKKRDEKSEAYEWKKNDSNNEQSIASVFVACFQCFLRLSLAKSNKRSEVELTEVRSHCFLSVQKLELMQYREKIHMKCFGI